MANWSVIQSSPYDTTPSPTNSPQAGWVGFDDESETSKTSSGLNTNTGLPDEVGAPDQIGTKDEDHGAQPLRHSEGSETTIKPGWSNETPAYNEPPNLFEPSWQTAKKNRRRRRRKASVHWEL